MASAMAPDELARRRAAADDLARQWDMAGIGSGFCAPGCSCGAGMLFAVGPQDIEADVVAYLQSRFPADKEPALARLLDSRALAASWGGAPPFGAWLRALAEASLEPGAFDALTEAVSTILQSLGEQSGRSGPASRFACT